MIIEKNGKIKKTFKVVLKHYRHVHHIFNQLDHSMYSFILYFIA